MSLNFYDSNGRAYAYSSDDVTIYTFTGEAVAYISNNSIYSFTGAHIGYFDNGIIRDDSGDSLLFADGASGGPIKPIKQIRPIKGIKSIKPIKGIKEIKPIKPIKSLNWSSYKPEDIFEN